MKFLIDMNLSPRWVEVLQSEGWDSVHWSEIGRPDATDSELMDWAREHGRVVLIHDLDFGAMLAATQATSPSVAQVGAQDVRPESLAPLLILVLWKYENELAEGALLIADRSRSRVRILPLHKS